MKLAWTFLGQSVLPEKVLKRDRRKKVKELGMNTSKGEEQRMSSMCHPNTQSNHAHGAFQYHTTPLPDGTIEHFEDLQPWFVCLRCSHIAQYTLLGRSQVFLIKFIIYLCMMHVYVSKTRRCATDHNKLSKDGKYLT